MKNVIILIILAFVFFTGCTEPGSKSVSELSTKNKIVVSFPDPNLEAVIREKIKKPTGYIYLYKVENITSLWGYLKNISDLTGIENCTSLTYLKLGSNSISDISSLSGLTSLTSLNLRDNTISDISPLVDNDGISTNDLVNLENNPLSDDSKNIYIPELQLRGIYLEY